jgi:hypothetical protein
MVVDQVVCMELRYGEVFADVSQLQAHRKLSHCHVVCDVCGLSMLRRQLKMHILLHTGGAPRIQFSEIQFGHTHQSNSYRVKPLQVLTWHYATSIKCCA